MNSSDKVLKIIFFILLIMIAGELLYFFFYKSIANKSTVNNQVVNVQVSSSPSDNSNRLISQDYMNYLNGIKKSEGRKIFLDEEIDGTISEISFKEYQQGGYLFKGFFTIVDSNNNIIQKFGLTDNRIKVWQFYLQDSKTGAKKPMSYKDIKLGQKVKFFTKSDMTTNPNGDILVNEFDIQE